MLGRWISLPSSSAFMIEDNSETFVRHARHKFFIRSGRAIETLLERGFRASCRRDEMTLPAGRALWLAQHICPHEPALRRWISRRSSSLLDIDDLVQETYAKLAILPATDHIANPRSYFFRTAMNILINEVRRSQVVPIESMTDLDQMELEVLAISPESAIEARQELRMVAEAIALLPEKCREVFILRKVHGLSQREIAEKMGISENTVEKQIGKGIRHLKDIFGRGGKDASRVSCDRISNIGTYDKARHER